MDFIVDRVWGFLKSIKLTVVLLALILTSSIIGTFVVQKTQSNLDVNMLYPKAVITLFNYFNFFDLYHSWWFNFLQFMLFLNLLICSIDKLPIYVKIFRTKPTIPQTKYKKTVLSSKNIKSIMNNFRGFKRLDKLDAYFFEWGRLSIFNPLIVHLGLIIIMLGGLIGSILGFSGKLILAPKQTSNTIKILDGERIIPLSLPFSVSLNSFNIEFYESSKTPKQYFSNLSIINRGNEIFNKEISVNKPLKYKGINFYQSSYKNYPSVNLQVKDKKTGKTHDLQVKFKNSQKIPETDVSLILVDYTSNFSMKGHVNLGEAVRLHVISKETKAPTWVFKKYPEFARLVDDRFQIILSSIKPGYETILDVTRNPGIPIIWAGFLTLILGLFLVSGYKHEQFFIVVEENKVQFLLKSNKIELSAEKSFEKFSPIIREL